MDGSSCRISPVVWQGLSKFGALFTLLAFALIATMFWVIFGTQNKTCPNEVLVMEIYLPFYLGSFVISAYLLWYSVFKLKHVYDALADQTKTKAQVEEEIPELLSQLHAGESGFNSVCAWTAKLCQSIMSIIWIWALYTFFLSPVRPNHTASACAQTHTQTCDCDFISEKSWAY